jgi:hemerythrin-like domain-containing protein
MTENRYPSFPGAEMTTSDTAWNDRIRLTEPVDFSMMYFAHDAFSRDLQLLRAAWERGDAGGAHELARWRMFTKQLEIHHRAEDTTLWPQLRGKALAAPEASVLDAMELEHAQLDLYLEDVEDALTGDQAALGDAVGALADGLTAHMRHEEQDALPLIAAHLGAKGWDQFGASMRKTQGLRGAAQYLPWLLDGAPEPTRTAVLRMLPPPLRLLYRSSWAPKYQRAVGSAPHRDAQRG